MKLRHTTTALAAALALGSVMSLAACVVVPLDPRTGQPYTSSTYGTGNQGAYSTTTNAIPLPQAAPAPPPQPAVLTARLYPLNPQASKGGMLTAVVVDGHGGRGSFNISYSGDSLQGEATRVDNGYAAFGHVLNDVLGPSQRSFSGQRGIANGYGGRGVSVQCEYLITGPGIGTGACLFSDGAKYQMHFGS